MAFTTAAAGLAVATLGAMYADARLLIRHDLTSGALTNVSSAAQKFMEDRTKENRLLIYHNFEYWASDPKTADNLFLMFEGRTWTYKQFYECLGYVGNWLIEELGIERKEIVALDGGNTPEYLMLWFGLESIGASPAFINCNLTKEPLVHSVKLCEARYILADEDVRHLVDPCAGEMKRNGCQTIYYSRSLLESLPTKYSNTSPKERRIGVMPDETASLIYTSGTTGLPKGVIMRRGRDLNTGRGVAAYLGLKPSDRMYTCLPLYHGAAHGLCVTPSVHAGSAVILSRKFSHRTFWPEVRESKANILQYVGELCRYLINAPPNPEGDQNHSVEMAWGNGMRPDVWENFRQRFNIPAINELYAATDGLGSSFNNNKGPFGVNAIGKRGLIWHFLNTKNEKRVKMDIDTEEIVRDPRTGFAVEVAVGEPGQVVHRMADPALKEAAFAGYYNNPSAGDKRWEHNLFAEGDLWFKSGDMQRQDADGTVYFVDRLGDTYRWKSENVSTNEVADVMGQWHQIAETNVVGAQVPHADGRCGLAAVVLAENVTEANFDFDGLAKHAIATLPRYAVPIFVRVVKEIDYTGTYKIQKGKLRSEGVDLDKVSGEDKIYWLPPGGNKYVPFQRKEWDDLKGGKVKL